MPGCSKGKPTSTVSGKVTYQGKPVTSGEVNFYAPQMGIGANAKLDSSGDFRIAQSFAAGTYKVFIQPPLPEQLPPGQVSMQKPFNVPRKYLDVNSTPLSREVKPGSNDFPIELTD
jgi:hypothetical protein